MRRPWSLGEWRLNGVFTLPVLATIEVAPRFSNGGPSFDYASRAFRMALPNGLVRIPTSVIIPEMYL